MGVTWKAGLPGEPIIVYQRKPPQVIDSSSKITDLNTYNTSMEAITTFNLGNVMFTPWKSG